jgi:hypothetical protein
VSRSWIRLSRSPKSRLWALHEIGYFASPRYGNRISKPIILSCRHCRYYATCGERGETSPRASAKYGSLRAQVQLLSRPIMKSVIGVKRDWSMTWSERNAYYSDCVLALGVGSTFSELGLGCPRRESVRCGGGWGWLGKSRAPAVQPARLAASLLPLRRSCRREWPRH